MVAELNENKKKASSESEFAVCVNCGHEVRELYCSKCGQSVKEIRVSFWILFREFLGEVFTFDSKFVRTIIPLFFRPGFLTHAFLQGRRVRYVRPVRLYLLSSVLFFLTLAIVSDGRDKIKPGQAADGTLIAVSNNGADKDQGPKAESGKQRNARFTDARFDNNTWYGRFFNKRLDTQDRKIQEMGYETFMQVLVNEFLASLPKALFLLMPLFALLLKLCYWRSNSLYIDHLIFAFHYHAFAYAFISILMITGSRSDVLLGFSIVLGVFTTPIYLLLALKSVYLQTWPWTLLKFFTTSVIYFAFLAVFLLLFFIFSGFFLV